MSCTCFNTYQGILDKPINECFKWECGCKAKILQSNQIFEEKDIFNQIYLSNHIYLCCIGIWYQIKNIKILCPCWCIPTGIWRKINKNNLTILNGCCFMYYSVNYDGKIVFCGKETIIHLDGDENIKDNELRNVVIKKVICCCISKNKHEIIGRTMDLSGPNQQTMDG